VEAVSKRGKHNRALAFYSRIFLLFVMVIYDTGIDMCIFTAFCSCTVGMYVGLSSLL